MRSSARTTPAVAVQAALPERGVDLDVQVPAGQVLAVLGANGAGKSTLVGLVSGLLRPASGTVRLRGAVVADDTTWVPAHARGVAVLTQEPQLFPHLDVLGNVAFGPRSAGIARRRAEDVARQHLAEVDAEGLTHRRPHEISGGQAQRVALARALAPDPDVVLLDEPLAALDVTAAAAMRQLLRRVLRTGRRTTVLVTHDLLDVLALADAVVVLEGGRVVERGAALEVLTRPRSAFAARLAGVNLVAGVLAEDGALATGGTLTLHGLHEAGCHPGGPVAATFSPRAVAVHRDAPGGSPRNAVPVRVQALEHQGELERVRAGTEDGLPVAADITPASVAALQLAPGQGVTFSVKAAEVTIYPA